MIRIGFYTHEIDFAGTWRSHERIIEDLQHRFETFVLYSPDIPHNRLELAKTILFKTTFVPFRRSKERLGPETGYLPTQTDFPDVCAQLNLDVLHFARSGHYEWPFTQRIARLQIETNIFGGIDTSGFCDRSIKISNVLSRSSDVMIPNPIPLATKTNNDLRQYLSIPSDAIVLGRIGRAAGFLPISFDGFQKASVMYPNLYYIVISGCELAKQYVSRNSIRNVFFLNPTNDDELIHRFHNTIDIFAHYRSDGEIHSTAIAQAMMYGIPVITHYAGANGQFETIGPGGFCVQTNDDYARAILYLTDSTLRNHIGSLGKKHTQDRSSQKEITSEIGDLYERWLQL